MKYKTNLVWLTVTHGSTAILTSVIIFFLSIFTASFIKIASDSFTENSLTAGAVIALTFFSCTYSAHRVNKRYYIPNPTFVAKSSAIIYALLIFIIYYEGKSFLLINLIASAVSGYIFYKTSKNTLIESHLDESHINKEDINYTKARHNAIYTTITYGIFIIISIFILLASPFMSDDGLSYMEIGLIIFAFLTILVCGYFISNIETKLAKGEYMKPERSISNTIAIPALFLMLVVIYYLINQATSY